MWASSNDADIEISHIRMRLVGESLLEKETAIDMEEITFQEMEILNNSS